MRCTVCLCVCVCVCVRARVCVRACMRVRVCVRMHVYDGANAVIGGLRSNSDLAMWLGHRVQEPSKVSWDKLIC